MSPAPLLLGGGLAVFALVYFGFAVTSHGWTVWPLFAVYGVYIAATEGVARAWIADTLPDRAAVGTAYGIFFLHDGRRGARRERRRRRALDVRQPARAVRRRRGGGSRWRSCSCSRSSSAGRRECARSSSRCSAAGVLVVAAAALAVAFEHRRLADAFRTGESEALPAAFVRPCGAAPTARVHVVVPGCRLDVHAAHAREARRRS